jgi:asparagine synthase (glutamine-hydrolysing)
MPGKLSSGFNKDNLDANTEKSLLNLRQSYKTIVSCFSGRIDTALSGGYDSRLTLALLHEQNETPKVHVYGKQNDSDVQVALKIDNGESLQLHHIDKSKSKKITIDEFSEIVHQNYLNFDGCPSDGIFDTGQDLATRKSRCSNGELMLNGGGGEVFRNFFYLLNKNYSIKQFLWCFYSRYDPLVCTTQFHEKTYLNKFSSKVNATLGLKAERFQRAHIELLYPIFRCRYWMGKNNSINNKFGYALTPFVDYNIVKDAIRIPLKYKNHGILEGRLIKNISKKLASYPSAYGYNFLDDPPLISRLKDLATYIRPAILRKYSYRIQMRNKKIDLPYYLEQSYLDIIFNTQFKYMSEFFNINSINDNMQFKRICTLEYLFNQISPNIN